MTWTSERRATVVHDPDAPRPNGLAVASLVLAILFGLIGLARTASRRSGFVPALLGTAIGCFTVFLWTTGYGVAW